MPDTIRYQVNLLDFLRTGRYGPIQLGMKKQEVENLLGKPDSWDGWLPWLPLSSAKSLSSDSVIWRYGAVEFHFGEQEELFLIYYDYLEELETESAAIQLNPWLFHNRQSLNWQQTVQALEKEGISYQYAESPVCGKFKLESGVDLIYDYEVKIIYAFEYYDGQFIGTPPEKSDNDQVVVDDLTPNAVLVEVKGKGK